MEIIISANKQIKSIYNSDSFIIHSEFKGVFNKELAMSHFHKVENFCTKS